jgi:hypothetical protein
MDVFFKKTVQVGGGDVQQEPSEGSATYNWGVSFLEVFAILLGEALSDKSGLEPFNGSVGFQLDKVDPLTAQDFGAVWSIHCNECVILDETVPFAFSAATHPSVYLLFMASWHVLREMS